MKFCAELIFALVILTTLQATTFGGPTRAGIKGRETPEDAARRLQCQRYSNDSMDTYGRSRRPKIDAYCLYRDKWRKDKDGAWYWSVQPERSGLGLVERLFHKRPVRMEIFFRGEIQVGEFRFKSCDEESRPTEYAAIGIRPSSRNKTFLDLYGLPYSGKLLFSTIPSDLQKHEPNFTSRHPTPEEYQFSFAPDTFIGMTFSVFATANNQSSACVGDFLICP